MENNNKIEEADCSVQLKVALLKKQVNHQTPRADLGNMSNLIVNESRSTDEEKENIESESTAVIANVRNAESKQMSNNHTDTKQSNNQRTTTHNKERGRKRKRKNNCLEQQSKRAKTNLETVNNTNQADEVSETGQDDEVRYVVQLGSRGSSQSSDNYTRVTRCLSRSRGQLTAIYYQNESRPHGPDNSIETVISNIIPEPEIGEVEYETITKDTVSRKMSKSWRSVPKYKLTASETTQQEADLYFSFLKENNDNEKVVPVQSGDRECCVCYENVATRVVIPCGHLCLCYNCAKTIALNRSTLQCGLLAKKCPLCQAAISKIIRPL